MPRHSLEDLIPSLHQIGIDGRNALPTLVLVVRHANARFNYEYRFFGDDGHGRVEVYDHGEVSHGRDPLDPKYTINGDGGHYGHDCQGFNYRQQCKHTNTVRAVWAEWKRAALVYFRLEKPVGPISDHMLTTGILFRGWLKKFYSENVVYNPADPEGFTVDLTI